MSNYPGGSVSGVCPKHQVPMISTITEKTLCAVCVSAELETYKNFFERLFAIVGPILPHIDKPHSELRALVDKVLEMERMESELERLRKIESAARLAADVEKLRHAINTALINLGDENPKPQRVAVVRAILSGALTGGDA